MRHLAALLTALLVAPLSWLLLAFGQHPPDPAFTAANSGSFERTLACVAGGLLLLGVLATLRLSPLGVIVTGSAYAAAQVALLVAPEATLRLFPHSVSVATSSADPTTPLRTGTALVLAVSMLIAAIGPSHRRPTRRQIWQQPPERSRTVQAPATLAAEPRAASRYPLRPRRPANRRSNAFGPPDSHGPRWPRNQQFT